MTTENEFSEGKTGAFPDLGSCRFETEVGGTVLRGTWIAPLQGNPRGDLLIHHGHGEHSGRYAHVADFFSRNGWRVWLYDMRGHGQSMGARGDVGCYGDLLGDLEAVLGQCMGGNRPFFLLGHSLGGQVALRAAQRWETAGSEVRNAGAKCLGVISASPYLRLAFSPGTWPLALAHLARRILPGWTTRSPVRASDLSSDETWLRTMPGCDLVHDRISARMFFEIEKTARGLLESGVRIRLPLLLLHGGDDRITSVEASRAFWSRTKPGRGSEFRVYEEFRHELFNERGREGVLREVLEWMEARLGAP
jgi:alpha-beta hydrolase superfamily lysophospholipase